MAENGEGAEGGPKGRRNRAVGTQFLRLWSAGPYRFHDAIRSFIGKMGVHDKKSVNDSGNDEAEREHAVQQKLDWLAAEQHGQRWTDKGESVSQGFCPLDVKPENKSPRQRVLVPRSGPQDLTTAAAKQR